MANDSKQTSLGDSIKPLYLNGLNRAEKKAALCQYFQSLPHTMEYTEKLTRLALAQNVPRNTVTQQASRYGFRLWHEELSAKAEATEVTDRQTGVLTVLQPVAPLAPAAFLGELRSFTRAALAVSNDFTLVTRKLVSLVIQQIDYHVAHTTEWDSYAWQQLDALHARLRRYLEPAKGFIAPGQIASLLTALDFKNSLPPEDQTGQQWATIADLQKMISEEANNLLPTANSLASALDSYQDLPDIAAVK
jgi:hypothetical protein